MSGFVHLHNHSDYSLLDGACRIDDYVGKASQLGMKHLGLTDHGNLFGALHFEQECRKAGINPVLGCEIYVANGSRFERSGKSPVNYHMVLYARNIEGYKNLMILTSKGYTEGFYYRPRIDDELLEKYHGGLMASAACLSGEIPRAIIDEDWDKARGKSVYYSELFGEDNFYLEVMNHGIPEEETVRAGMRRLSKETGIPIIATNDVHFLEREHANAHDIFICISTGKKRADEKRLRTENPEFYFKNEEEMRKLFPDFRDAIENTVKLAMRCELAIPRLEHRLPHYEIPREFADSQSYLRYLTFEGIKKRYCNADAEKLKIVNKRAEFELNVLSEMAYVDYFLIVWDFIDWAYRQDIPVGPGRGSGAGSLVAFALRITDIDPLKYDLLFERFLNPERVNMPDFDIDFCYERRNEVIEYVHEKYGRENVAGICTFGTLKTKAVLKDVARVLDIPFSESNTITKLVPEGKTPDGREIDMELALEMEPRLMEFHEKGAIYRELFDVARILEGMNRHVSTHACGKVIGRGPLTDYVPLIKDQKTGDVITAYTMDAIETCGLVKMDFLGLKTLTLLKNCEALIRKPNPKFDIDIIPEDDAATFEMLGEGRSEAVFQFESQGMQRILKEAKPVNIEELIALNALYRPGPMQYITKYVESKHNRREIQYPHPDLKGILQPTYGVIIYQEQVMKVAQMVGGFSLGKADILRQAMGKKKEQEMARMELEFIEGAKKRGYDSKLAKDIYEMLKPFAGYGFNKSHAAAYSVIAYKTAFCKANHPAEFWAANLTNEIDSTDTLRDYLAYAKNEGVKILPPEINLSERCFTVNRGRIIYGLMGIRGMGQGAADAITEARGFKGKFTSFPDFLDKVDLKSLNRKVLEISIQVGLFDRIEQRNRATLLHNLDRALEAASRRRDDEASGQISLFTEAETAVEARWEEIEGWTKSRLLRLEKEHLGFYVSGHPLDSYRPLWEKLTNLNTREIELLTSKKIYSILGILKDVRTLSTHRGDNIAFAILEDLNGTVELAVFSEVYRKFGHLLIEEDIVLIRGKIDLNRDNPQLRVDEILEPGTLDKEWRREDPALMNDKKWTNEERKEAETVAFRVHIELVDAPYTEEELIALRSLFQGRSGTGQLYLHVTENGTKSVIKASDKLSFSVDDVDMDSIKKNHSVATVWKETP